ncbi:hypothetical protein [Paenibacillus tundrae]|uniref:Uncharacterized protein n=1 Tax=Paenibacillus tundrae TaxID=528187 RepID=A0ABT9WDT0_9BACL|nr:hypothetical protein [Paenibacillus tundrae]MDQ0171416.1 hypothetical protein [Paenibacillus tundrae]
MSYLGGFFDNLYERTLMRYAAELLMESYSRLVMLVPKRLVNVPTIR